MRAKRLRKKSIKILLAILVILIGVRIALPGIVKKYLNNQLSSLENYSGYIHDVDIALIRGAYVIDSIYIIKKGGKTDKPLFTADKIDISLEWSALFNGAIVGEIHFEKPDLLFIASEKENEKQYGEDEDWLTVLKSLLPININHFSINDGNIELQDYFQENINKVYLKQLNLDISNISNVINEDEFLPSSYYLSAYSLGNGKLKLQGKANFLKEIPDIDYDLSFEEVDITALNNFLKAYAGVDAESGTFYLYHELALSNQEIKGYVKPLLKDTKIFKWKNDNESLSSILWEPLIGVFKGTFENPNTNQFGTKVPLEGTIKDTRVKVIESIWHVFKNAFIKALKNETDNSVDIRSD